MDLPDDIFSEPAAVIAPVRSKFQPKVKPRPKKGSLSTSPTHTGVSSKEQPIPPALVNLDSSPLVQSKDFVNKNLDFPFSSSTECAGTEHTSLRREASNLEHVLTDANLSAEVGNVDGSYITGHLSVDASLGSQGSKDIVGQLSTADTPTLDATQAEEDRSGFPSAAFPSPSPLRPRSAHRFSIPSTDQESRSSEETFLGNARNFQIDIEEETVDFSFLEAVDISSEVDTPGSRVVKFQPKPKAQNIKKKDLAEVVSHLPDVGNVSSENQPINGSDLFRPSKTATIFSPSHVRLYGETNESGDGYFGGVNDGTYLNRNSPSKALHESAANSDENDDFHLEVETSKKKRLQNCKKVSFENDKPSRKRKEAIVPEESTEKPCKKFRHGTRRKRYVDKSLLEAPEDEIDFQRVSIRDLIKLADYKERQKKKAPVVQPPTTNERFDNTLQEDPPYDEDGTYGSDQDTGSIDDPSTSRVIKDSNYFNYQSFMGGKQKRWSKHETEVFYQGILEFGSDFTMIQQRYFSDRSRNQVKLKYKKEEREQPMRIHDALTSRAKDLSHFELLIQKLQEHEQAAQEKAEQTSDDDNLIGSMDAEDGGRDGEAHETQEAAKSEQKGKYSVLSQELPDDDDTAKVQTPAKSHNSEDEDHEFDCSDY